jgi:hypothetical protein
VRMPQQQPMSERFGGAQFSRPGSSTLVRPGRQEGSLHPAYGCNIRDCIDQCDYTYSDRGQLNACYRSCQMACS